jgi:HK97 gp10 family phage protein
MSRASARAAGANARSSIELDSAAFMASLTKAVAKVKIDSEAELWQFALMTQNLARLYCPVDTGRLRSSIQASRGRDTTGVFADIGTNVEYAVFVEFGTRYMAAQPYLRPALAVAAAQWGQGVGSAGF